VGAGDSEWIARRLRERGVDTAPLQIDGAGQTGLTVAVSTAEDRAFFTYRGANRLFPGALGNACAARHLHLACLPPWELDAVKLAGTATVSLDTGWHPSWLSDARALDWLSPIDIFFPNQPEAALITGESTPERILQRFADAGVRRVALKLGSQGAALLWDGKTYYAGPHPVTPIETTGAGDCFNAGFLYEWLRGATPETCLRTANICGALSTQSPGGIEGFPSLERILCL